ncbi:MAG TPA: hypothetical protein VJT71_17875 [Pyrinomonadaceae bacterium]|nr:hypothetical protein [Pyrinomonadaceae bacterium]
MNRHPQIPQRGQYHLRQQVGPGDNIGDHVTMLKTFTVYSLTHPLTRVVLTS